MSSSLQSLLTQRRIEELRTNALEIRTLLEAADRDVADAQVEGISSDRAFACAYYGALGLATVVLRASGYRTRGDGHHKTTLTALPHLLGADARPVGIYLDRCRTKRNRIDYDGVGFATSEDVDGLLEEIAVLRAAVLAWLTREHPELA